MTYSDIIALIEANREAIAAMTAYEAEKAAYAEKLEALRAETIDYLAEGYDPGEAIDARISQLEHDAEYRRGDDWPSHWL